MSSRDVEVNKLAKAAFARFEAGLSLVPSHTHDGLRLYVLAGIKPGLFCLALLADDITGAFARADIRNAAALETGRWEDFLNRAMPIGSWGDPTAVEEWSNHKGLAGLCGDLTACPKRGTVAAVVQPDGSVTMLYGDALAGLVREGHGPTSAKVRRASTVLPCDEGDGWTADLAVVRGPRLGPFPTYQEAVDAEIGWLFAHLHTLAPLVGVAVA